MTMLTGALLDSFEASTTDVATAVTLPPEIYTSEEFLAFERRALVRARVVLRRGWPAGFPKPATGSPPR